MTNVQAPDFKESSHNTHSLILISEPITSIVSYTTNSNQDESVSSLMILKLIFSIKLRFVFFSGQITDFEFKPEL